jgi:hypothetical protein
MVMTAEEKIEESEYNLQKLANINPMLKAFRFELSNFLNSAQSILYHLLEEYNIKYHLQLEHLDIKAFKKQATRLRNTGALNFIEWYKKEYEQIKNEVYGFLIDKRHVNVHKQVVKTVRHIGMNNMKMSIPANTSVMINIEDLLWKGAKTAKVTMTDLNTKEQEQIDMPAFNKTVFNENEEKEALTLCGEFLDRLKKLVNDAHSKF